MTREQQTKCIEQNCEAFKRTMLGKASKIPSNWEDAEIRQWVMDCAKDAWVSKMPATQMNRYRMAKQIYGL